MQLVFEILSGLSVALSACLGLIVSLSRSAFDKLSDKVEVLENARRTDQVGFATIVEKIAGLAAQVERHQDKMELNQRQNVERDERYEAQSTHWRHEVLTPRLSSLILDTQINKDATAELKRRVEELERSKNSKT